MFLRECLRYGIIKTKDVLGLDIVFAYFSDAQSVLLSQYVCEANWLKFKESNVAIWLRSTDQLVNELSRYPCV